MCPHGQHGGPGLHSYLAVRRQCPPSSTQQFLLVTGYYCTRGWLTSLNSNYVILVPVRVRNDQNINYVLLLLPGQGWVQVSSKTIFLFPSIMGSTSAQNSSSTALLRSSTEPSLTTQEMFLVLLPSPHWASWNKERNN